MPPVAVLVALADPTRCRIVEILHAGAQPVHILAASFAISRPAISRHLRVLKQARLISETKTGRENRYRLHPDKLKPVAKWLAEMQLPKVAATPAKAPVKARPAKRAAAPTPAPEPAPAEIAVVAPKRAAAAPVFQMGFDF